MELVGSATLLLDVISFVESDMRRKLDSQPDDEPCTLRPLEDLLLRSLIPLCGGGRSREYVRVLPFGPESRFVAPWAGTSCHPVPPGYGRTGGRVLAVENAHPTGVSCPVS
jgi:hypothetical protein